MRILLVEDDKKLSEAIVYWLEQNQYTVDSCENGEDGLYYIEQNIHDCILLDRMLPALPGLAILQKMRAAGNQTPVILITALGSLKDKVDGLDCGADDYLVKPFAFEELAARIRSVTRRPPVLGETGSLTFGDIRYIPDTNVLDGSKGSLTLSKKEGSVLEALLRSQGKTLSREYLLTKVWGPDTDIELTNLDNYVHFLRRRLKTAGCRTGLSNVWGVGYRLEEPVSCGKDYI